MAEFLGCTTQASVNHSSTLQQSNDDCEVFRQRFRHFQYQKVAGPREAFNNLWELCSKWLKPKMHSKDEILEQLVLEQFLCVLPMELQTWGKLYRSENRERILSLLEELQKELKVAEQQQNMLTFDDVTLSFSPSEWELLDPSQKELYKEVMQDIYGSAISLGLKFKNDGPTIPFEQGSGNTSEEIPQEATGIGNLYGAYSMEKHHEDGSGKLRKKCPMCNQELPKHMSLGKMDGSGDTPFEC